MGDKELFCAFQDVPSGAALGELFFIYFLLRRPDYVFLDTISLKTE